MEGSTGLTQPVGDAEAQKRLRARHAVTFARPRIVVGRHQLRRLRQYCAPGELGYEERIREWMERLRGKLLGDANYT